MQCHTQAGIINTNLKVKTGFTIPELSTTKIVTCNFHVGESAKFIYGIILGRYLLTDLGLNTTLSDCVVEADYGYFKGLMLCIVVLDT